MWTLVWLCTINPLMVGAATGNYCPPRVMFQQENAFSEQECEEIAGWTPGVPHKCVADIQVPCSEVPWIKGDTSGPLSTCWKRPETN